MQRVFVLSADGQALDPCHPARARKLLRQGRAAEAQAQFAQLPAAITAIFPAH